MIFGNSLIRKEKKDNAYYQLPSEMKKKTLNQCVKVTFRGLFQQEKNT